MREREESGDYGEDGIHSNHVDYMAGMDHGRYPNSMYPYYFFRPDLPIDMMQGAHHGKYDMKYPGDQGGHFGHQMPVCGYPDMSSDQERIRSIWKKEKNRIAAKKSREKKMIHLRELEKRENLMICEISDLKEAVCDYDNVLKSLLDYIEDCLGRSDNEHKNFVLLFDCLCRLKKPEASHPIYFHDVGHLVSNKLSVTNERIDKIVGTIRDSLSSLFERA